MQRKIYILVNGILTRPGDARDWNFRGVTWTHLNTDHRARNFEYYCTPIGRAFGQMRRARKLANLISHYAGWDIVMVMHSNGGDVGLNALRLLHWPRIEELHFVSAACENDFNHNGLNQALGRGKVGKVIVYRAGRDIWLRIADLAIGRWLGYGTLGLHGPVAVIPSVASKVEHVDESNYGHSSWWANRNFDNTMAMIV